MIKHNELAHQQSQKLLATQVRITLTILRGIGGRFRKQMDEQIAYRIAKYAFRNPLRLKVDLFTLSNSLVFHPKVSYLLVSNNSVLCHAKLSGKTTNNDKDCLIDHKKSSEASAYITILSTWKSVQVNHNNLSEVLNKGQRLLLFFKSIELFPLNWNDQVMNFDDFDIDRDLRAYERNKQQNKKRYHLVSDNSKLVHSYFQGIMIYKKDKKVNDLLVKAFLYFLKRSIAIVKIEQNYNTDKLGCEGKFLYIENSNNLPLTTERGDLTGKQYPSLRLQNEKDWVLNQTGGQMSFKKYEIIKYPLSRGKNLLVSRKLNGYLQQDAWLQEMQ